MLEEKKCINNEELCEGKKELTQEELEQVNGGVEISTIGCSGTTHSAAIAKE